MGEALRLPYGPPRLGFGEVARARSKGVERRNERLLKLRGDLHDGVGPLGGKRDANPCVGIGGGGHGPFRPGEAGAQEELQKNSDIERFLDGLGGTPDGLNGVVYVSLEANPVAGEHGLGYAAYKGGNATEDQGERAPAESHAQKDKKVIGPEICAAKADLFG